MLSYSADTPLDELDRQILQLLQEEGRINHTEVARRVSLSPPAVHARVKRLEQAGYIRGYAALLDRERLGYDLLCFIHVAMQQHTREQVLNFRLWVAELPTILECYHVTGEFDYLLKGVFSNRQALEHFLVDQLALVPGVVRVHTSVVFSEVKSSSALPI